MNGFDTGGTIHIVINNQVGFTTSPGEARSTTYCTDVAKMLEAPVFHVNGDDPESLVWVAQLAAEYRARFSESVFIDIVCYRRYGHNEGDEPSFTQPELYSRIKPHTTTRNIYSQKLLNAGLISAEDDLALKEEVEAHFAAEQEVSKKDNITPYASAFEGRWIRWKPTQIEEEAPTPPSYTTAVEESVLQAVGKAITEYPSDFKAHPKIQKFLELRKTSLEQGENLDWATCEALAIGSLLKENHSVRLSGQDAQRGTFTHRHSVLSDTLSGKKFCPLKTLDSEMTQFEVVNSTLSETAVLAFEYGYSLSSPARLVIWEAQFGDFSNGAQVIIDQFITSSEIKWQRASGLVLYLPHGYEGQGPEHSSARLERFLQLSAEKNITVCNLTTAGNLFHALRRQVKRSYRKPLVIMTPKSLLRYGPSFSPLKELSEGSFKKVIPESTLSPEEILAAKEVILCSGKIYYELLEYRQKNNIKTPIFRLEQFHPLPRKELVATFAALPNLERVKWVQEEPRNQGAWTFLFMEWLGASGTGFAGDLFLKINKKIPLNYIGRKAAAAPAGGSFKTHQKTQAQLIEMAFAIEEKDI
ncbi:MAG: 2-oxoglutarate dehydrogenase E1 component [Bdellovibrionota bacterium]